MKPGVGLDRALAEAIGLTLCHNEDCEGCDATGGYLLRGGKWAGVTAYSTDIAETVNAAEELRKAGKIIDWHTGVSGASAFSVVVPNNGKRNFVLLSFGDSPAHALTLALLAALKPSGQEEE